LQAKKMARPFQPVAVEYIAATIAAARDINDVSVQAVSWDLMQAESVTMAGVIKHFRIAFGTPAGCISRCRHSCSTVRQKLDDLASLLGWISPMRSTAIADAGCASDAG
jgi:hypothetical protein